MKAIDSSYQFGFVVAIVIHLMVLAALVIDMAMPVTGGNTEHTPVNIVQAVTVDESLVKASVNRIQQQEQQRKLEHARAQQELVLKQRLEQERLKQIQTEITQANERKQKALEENALAEKKLKALEAQHADIALKKLHAREQLAAAMKERERIKNLNQQRAANDAKKAAQHQKQAAQLLKQKELMAKQKAREDERMRELAEEAHQRQMARMTGIVNRYAALIKQSIAARWILPKDINSNMSCRVQIHLAPNGRVLSVSMLTSSGSVLLDRSVNAAIYKASPLPVPAETEAFEQIRVINMTLRPEQVISTG